MIPTPEGADPRDGPLRAAVAGTWSLLLGMGVLMLGAGLQGSLSGLRATLEGFPTWATGIVMSGYYLGYMGSSALTPRLVRNVGHVRVFAALTALASATVLLQAAFVTPVLWTLLRAASGFCFAGIYVVAESWLNDRATNRNRGALLAAYMAVLYGGLGGGQFLLLAADPAGPELFMLTAGLLSIALVPLALTAQRAPEFALPRKIGLATLYHASPLGVAGVATSGIVTGTLFALGPVYAKLAGLSTPRIAGFMSASILAAVLTLLPVGRLSDRVDRRSVLIAVCLLAAAAAGVAPLLVHRSYAALVTVAAIFGGLALTLYSLALSHVNDHLTSDQMVAASGSIVLLNGAGAACGPVLVAVLMDLAGPWAYFASLSALIALLAVFGLWRKVRRAPVPAAAKGPFVAAQPQAPVVPVLLGAAEPGLSSRAAPEPTPPEPEPGRRRSDGRTGA